MSTKQVKDAIMDLLKRELPHERCTLKELEGKIEVILNFLPPKRSQRDKNAPKKTKTAYTFFCQENRTETMEEMGNENKEVKSVDVVRALAGKWKELKQRCDIADEDALSEMNGYKAQSLEDMGRYLEENAAYVKKLED